MDIRPGEITDILKREIKDYEREIDVAETGTVLSVGDGIARVFGLEQAMAGELVEFPGGLIGVTLNIDEDDLGVVLMGEASHIEEGDPVTRARQLLSAPPFGGMISVGGDRYNINKPEKEPVVVRAAEAGDDRDEVDR